MTSNEQFAISSPANKHSIISLIFGIITLLLFCGGILIPVPFTSLICVPISAIVGAVALIYGFIALNRIKKHNESGHPMAWTGIVIGGFVLLCMICALITIASLFYFSPDTLYVPPFIQKFEI